MNSQTSALGFGDSSTSSRSPLRTFRHTIFFAIVAFLFALLTFVAYVTDLSWVAILIGWILVVVFGIATVIALVMDLIDCLWHSGEQADPAPLAASSEGRASCLGFDTAHAEEDALGADPDAHHEHSVYM